MPHVCFDRFDFSIVPEECRKETEVRQVNDWSGPFLTDLGVNLYCLFTLTGLLPSYPA